MAKWREQEQPARVPNGPTVHEWMCGVRIEGETDAEFRLRQIAGFPTPRERLKSLAAGEPTPRHPMWDDEHA